MTPSRTTEREIKLAAHIDLEMPDLRGIVGGTVRLPEQHLRTAYFDTPDFRLWKRGITLRHRSGEQEGNGTWTIKLPAGNQGHVLERTELSWSGRRDAFPAEVTKVLRGIVRRSTLRQVAELETTRRRLVLHDREGVSYGEIDDDIVTVINGNNDGHQFRQVEIEFGSARRKVLERVVRTLGRAGAQPENKPKLAKALQLPPQDTTATRTADLGPRSSMEDVIKATLAEGLDRLLDHDYRLRLDPFDPAPHDVHQARVAARRLRSDLKLFRSELDPVWIRHTRGELKWLGALLGDVRDTDVLLGSLLAEGKESATEAGGILELRAKLYEQRHIAAQKLGEAMDDERYLNLLDHLQAASLHPPLTEKAKRRVNRPRGRDADGKEVLPRLVGRRWRGLRRTVRKAGHHPSDRRLHRMRIRAKQLRYAAETAQPVIGRSAQRMASSAEELQTVLGEHHDSVVAEQWLTRQVLVGTRNSSFSAGLLVADERRRQRRLRRRWRPVWAALDRKKVRRWLHS